MPGLDGLETCRAIKANPEIASIPVIFMTALDSIDDKIAGFAAGGVDYITKPFQQVEVLARVNTHITIQRQYAELQEQKIKLEEMAITDELTGLYNRRYLNKVLTCEFDHSQRYGTDLSCLMFDLDHFKDVNDTYGHDIGDVVLCRFACLLKDFVRSSDFVFRFGGEEFVVLLPQTDQQGAMDTAEKIRQTLATEEIIIQPHDVSLAITVSVGVSTLLEHKPKTYRDLVNLADKALYCAKEKGRNQTRLYECKK